MIFPSEMLFEDMLDLDAGIFQKSPGTLASRKPLSSFQLISYLIKTILKMRWLMNCLEVIYSI